MSKWHRQRGLSINTLDKTGLAGSFVEVKPMASMHFAPFINHGLHVFYKSGCMKAESRIHCIRELPSVVIGHNDDLS